VAVLDYSKRGTVGILTLCRPQRKNALSREMLDAFAAMRARVQADTELRALIITGSGDAFCAGADLKERATMSDVEVRAQLDRYRSALTWLDTASVPVVAAINGAALGGGLELALLCDLRIAAPTAILGLPETRLGIIPGAGGTQRLVHVVGESMAKRMILLGERIDAQTALARGLVHQLASSAEALLDETLTFIAPIADGAPIAQAAALAAIDAARSLPLAAGLDLERREYERCLVSEDRKEALAAFAEKRAPVFRGR
jgi:enoyl-CoA hydratase/carnithine racemase